MKKGKYRVVVVGCGKVGVLYETEPRRSKPASHAGHAARGLKTALVALVDTDPRALGTAGRLFPRAARYRSAQECLDKEQPDIVVLATPPRTHLSLIRLCAKAGVRAVVCEKPLATSLREAQEIVRTVARSNMVFVLNYQRRFSPLLARTRRAITASKVEQATCYYSRGLYNNGGHAIDALLYLLGPMTVRWARANKHAASPAGDPCVDAVLETQDGARVVLQSIDQHKYGIFDIRILTAWGEYALLDYSETLVETPARPSIYKGEYALDRAQARIRRARPSTALAEAVCCLKGHGKPKSGIGNGLEVMKLLSTIKNYAKKR